MAKYKVEVGGFVTVFRHREFTAYAANKEEAAEKAVQRFIKAQSENGDCDDAVVDNVERIE